MIPTQTDKSDRRKTFNGKKILAASSGHFKDMKIFQSCSKKNYQLDYIKHKVE